MVRIASPSPAVPAQGLKAIRRETLAEAVAAQIRRAIISGEMEEGSSVSETQLADQLQVSRVPVREALVQLEHDGIVLFDYRGRCQIRVFSHGDFEEILSLRFNLEIMSARLASTRMTPDAWAAIEKNVAALERETDVTNISRLDVEFHDLIMEASCHERLRTCWNTVRTQFELLLAKVHRWQKQHDIPVSDHALRGHRPIVQALRSGDPEKAAQQMEKHIRDWGDLMSQDNSLFPIPS